MDVDDEFGEDDTKITEDTHEFGGLPLTGYGLYKEPYPKKRK